MNKRREFIKKSLMGTDGIAIGGKGFSSGSYSSIIGANDRINIAVVGIGSRGANISYRLGRELRFNGFLDLFEGKNKGKMIVKI